MHTSRVTSDWVEDMHTSRVTSHSLLEHVQSETDDYYCSILDWIRHTLYNIVDFPLELLILVMDHLFKGKPTQDQILLQVSMIFNPFYECLSFLLFVRFLSQLSELVLSIAWHPGLPMSTSISWPWTVKASLAVLWGVCWMFYDSPLPNDWQVGPEDLEWFENALRGEHALGSIYPLFLLLRLLTTAS